MRYYISFVPTNTFQRKEPQPQNLMFFMAWFPSDVRLSGSFCRECLILGMWSYPGTKPTANPGCNKSQERPTPEGSWLGANVVKLFEEFDIFWDCSAKRVDALIHVSHHKDRRARVLPARGRVDYVCSARRKIPVIVYSLPITFLG